MKSVKFSPGFHRSATYQIKVPGRLDSGWSEIFEGFTVTVEDGEEWIAVSTLTGVVDDQAALHGIINRLYSMGYLLLSVILIKFET